MVVLVSVEGDGDSVLIPTVKASSGSYSPHYDEMGHSDCWSAMNPAERGGNLVVRARLSQVQARARWPPNGSRKREEVLDARPQAYSKPPRQIDKYERHRQGCKMLHL
jgi:hypothetical protein